ncbi:MAG: formate/nitrite transporter family protein [Clostridiales bacterium]|nr:formate/nitrite transporter family protein [Clostridiales bacterium]
MNNKKIFVSAILAGACIGFGGVAFLSLDSKVLGSFFFTVGLFCICTFGLHLFTGKICYVFDNDKRYALSMPVIWLGNLIGTGIVALMVRLSRIAPIAEKAATLCQTKMDDQLLSLFLLGILCNIFIYIGVEGYRTITYEVGKYLALFFGVMVFILCGYEHCVADMFYFSVAGMWNGRSILCLLVITLGNAVGGIIFPLVRGYLNK